LINLPNFSGPVARELGNGGWEEGVLKFKDDIHLEPVLMHPVPVDVPEGIARLLDLLFLLLLCLFHRFPLLLEFLL